MDQSSPAAEDSGPDRRRAWVVALATAVLVAGVAGVVGVAVGQRSDRGAPATGSAAGPTGASSVPHVTSRPGASTPPTDPAADSASAAATATALARAKVLVDDATARRAACEISAAAVRGLAIPPGSAGKAATPDQLRDAVPTVAELVDDWATAARGRPALADAVGVAILVVAHWRSAIAAQDAADSAAAAAALRRADAALGTLDGTVAGARAAVRARCG